MAKKSKEIEVGGYRIQIDPLILARRILGRQKKFLTLVAVIGGLITIWMYKTTPKQYTSYSEVVIRAEAFQEDYLRKLLNVVARYVGSDTEMMIIINELNLYAASRASLPYDIALRGMRQELRIDRAGEAININFRSKSPQEAQRVVAFVTERMLTKLADLKDSPYRQQIEAIRTGLSDVQPKLNDAQLRMFEFKEKYPDIAIKTPEFLVANSPQDELSQDLDRAQKDLKRCYGGVPEAPAPKPQRKATPGCTRLKELERERATMLGQFTPSHPSVIALDKEISEQQGVCEREQEVVEEKAGPIKPGMSQAECVAAVTARIKRLNERKVSLEKGAARKPKLQRQWATLNIEVNALELQLTALKETEARTVKERLLAANEFRDSFVLVTPPRIPELPSFPDRNQFLGFGMAVTFIVGMFFATLREALRQTFSDARELEEQTGIPVLASLPNITGTNT